MLPPTLAIQRSYFKHKEEIITSGTEILTVINFQFST